MYRRFLKLFCSVVGAGLTLAGAASCAPRTPPVVSAAPTGVFLDSIGVVSTFPDRGQPLERTVEMVRYGGFRWVRAGIEGLSDDGPTTIQTFIDLHAQTGAKVNWGLVSGGTDIGKLIENGRILAQHGALLAFEGANEPNNWSVTYKGEKGGGPEGSWMAVAKLQRDLYAAVKSDPVLARYPVWSLSEPGAQEDNVGLQFLTIPSGAKTLMPPGTRYADAANIHNYIYHPHAPYPRSNKVWNAADPSAASKVDGLYGNHGKTWRKGFAGYSEQELASLPRVTTETGARVGGAVTEEIHGRNLVNLYLAQFNRGYSHTSVYLLRDRTDEDGPQTFGFFRPDYTPRKAAVYLHNLTTILADPRSPAQAGALAYAIEGRTRTVHDLLLQHSGGAFQLVIWGERLRGADPVRVRFGETHAKVTVYDPTRGVQPLQTLGGVDQLELKISDHPVVIVISG